MDFRGLPIINIREGMDTWGPFLFPFTTLLPDGETIGSVSVKAYSGEYKPDMHEADQTEITIISGAPEVAINGLSVSLNLNYPTEEVVGTVTLVFTVTGTVNGGDYPFFCHKVRII